MSEPKRRQFLRPFASGLIAIVFYILSSGPMLGLAFLCRETFHRDEFYAMIWLYYPLFCFGHASLLENYIGWWVVSVFHTVGPG